MKPGRDRVWWWVLAVGLALDPLWSAIGYPLRAWWATMLGRTGYAVLSQALIGAQPLLVALSALALFIMYRKRVSSALRSLAVMATSLSTLVAVGNAALAMMVIFNLIGIAQLGLTDRTRPVAALPLVMEPFRDVIVSLLLVALAAAAARSAVLSRALVAMLLSVAIIILLRMLHALPQNWHIVNQVIGLPAWSQPPGWLSIRWWLGFGPDRTANRLLGIAMATLAIAAMWVSGALSRRELFPLPGHCSACGYDLHGLAQGSTVCPECGGPVPAAAA